MTALLLDTHVLIWWIQRSSRLGQHAIDRIESTPTVMFSALSVMEIELKRHRLGSLPDNYLDSIRATGFTELRLCATDAREMEKFRDLSDPFDRGLVAQARAREMLLMTADRAILQSAPVTAIPA